ncbi:uncharacterized protein [Rutidosis leptorrhynchoides]|uniref:uncharacterized protein n=1 Tax=Rutidosis leptorrhynchoides TaxID=125765 RepID=UPI003A992BD6
METPAIGLKWADEKLLFNASTTSSDALVSITNTEKEKLSTDDINRMVKLCCTEHFSSLREADYMQKIREFNDRLDMVKNLVRPGCSHEVLNTALSYMTSLANFLSHMPQKLQASL